MNNELNLTLDEVMSIRDEFTKSNFHISKEILRKIEPLYIELKRLDDIERKKGKIKDLKNEIKHLEYDLSKLETTSIQRDKKIDDILNDIT